MNTPDTEVLRMRFEGNLTVPHDHDLDFVKERLEEFFKYWEYGNTFTVVPQDSETGMRLYKVEEVEGMKEQIQLMEAGLSDLRSTAAENDKAFKSLSEELEQERELKETYQEVSNIRLDTITVQRKSIEKAEQIISALQKKLELAENTNWNTFIKWCKGLWR